MDSKLIGGILLIVGTCIGGGMLALPIATSTIGFVGSSLLFVVSWLIMLLGAFAILEVNCWLAPGSNIISMAQKTLGVPGKVLAWFAYLFLLYAVLSAYISGGSDIFQALFQHVGLNMPMWLSTIAFVCVFGSIVYCGVKAVDYSNRALMFGKLGVCALLLMLILPRVELPNLISGQWHYTGSVIMLTVTSFSFSNIVPSLTAYFDGDIPKLRKAILIGSLIPLVAYIAWNAAIMGVIPLDGHPGLLELLQSNRSTTDLTLTLTALTHSTWITYFFRLFTSICMLTAFLGVSLGLFDFLADGLNVHKKGRSAVLIVLLAYLPPLLIVLFYPGIFISALSYAGVFCVILLLLMPMLMLWKGRYIKSIAERKVPYLVKGGKPMLILMTLIAMGLIYLAVAY